MVHNELVACDVCGTVINLRIQMGYYDIPVHIRCPECKSNIDGMVQVEPFEINIDNVDSSSIRTEKFYSFELSAEFPTRKMIFKSMKELELTPFIRNFIFYDDLSEAYDLTKKSMEFATFLSKDWRTVKQNFGLLVNKNFELLFPRLERIVQSIPVIPIKQINNELDATIVNHQILLITSGIAWVVGNDALVSYMKLGNKINNSSDKLEQVLKFIENQNLNFNTLENKVFSLIDIFAKVYEQLVPVVSLRNAQALEKVDQSKYGITTASFEELSDFYAKSYEWILANINLIVGLNNIFVRNNFDLCVNGKSISTFSNLSNGLKLKQNYLNNGEPFSRPVASLHNRLRNAIQHFDCEIDYQTQKIIFHDRNKAEETTLLDFADLCIENFSIVFYLLEIMYNLKKIKLVSIGLRPSVSTNS